MKKILSIAAILALSTGSLFADTATQNFQVTATVASSCQINSASELAFGTYDPLSSTDKEATNTISITCSTGTHYDVGLDDGLNSDAGARNMSDGSNNLNYEIYTDSGKTTPWNSTNLVSGDATSSSTAIDLVGYGTLTAGQDVPEGSYSDTIVATISY
jgi:spore coat protein U-like protein